MKRGNESLADEESRLREVAGTAQCHTASWEENQPHSSVPPGPQPIPLCFQEMMWEFLPDPTSPPSPSLPISPPTEWGPGITGIRDFLRPAWDLPLQSPLASRIQRTQSQFHSRETLEETQLKHSATWVPGQLVSRTQPLWYLDFKNRHHPLLPEPFEMFSGTPAEQAERAS